MKIRISRAGIIAAGLGTRLSAAYPRTPKPLVPIRGKPLVHWVVEGLRSAGLNSLTIALNASGDPVRRYLETQFTGVDWTFLRRDTASSWETFRLLSGELAARSEGFLISTVDAFVSPEELRAFAREALSGGRTAPETAVALTRFVQDEKPLWADLGPDGFLTAFGPDARRRETVTCGLYALTRGAERHMPAAAALGRLRDYWISLVRAGRPVRGVLLGDSVDLDRPEDIPAAEKMTACF